MKSGLSFAAILLLAALPIPSANAAGRQLTGVYTPAATPALPPEEAVKKFTLPPGFEARIFASEPDVVNPVGMTWDERGRLWVVELFEYPLGAAPGTKPRDKIKVLEDTDGDGRADKVTVFADGLNLATGVLVGHGGVYVGQAPHLYFMEDTDGDDVADKKTIVLTGFGLEDRHELLNGFTWGPDGMLFMTHGVFTYSSVKDPDDPSDDGVTMTAAVARFHPLTKKFEVFAEGTSNPWGVDFDRTGNAFVSACVIDHLFHMAPGGIYQRQAGTPPHPYAYELLPSIVDHKHFRAAYAGVQVYQGNQYPEEYRGTIFMGNIHDNSVHQDRLTPHGSSFKASFVRDFLRTTDGWFRPVSIQTGPDGALWVMDWYDKYPCYQNANADPEGVDREYGRIWRVVYTGDKAGAPIPPRPAGLDLKKLSTAELVKTLTHPNSWHRRMAQQVLSHRRDSSSAGALQDLLREGPALETRLAALWTLHSSGLLDGATLDRYARDPEPAIRTWVARLTGERAQGKDEDIARLRLLAQDDDPSVLLGVMTAARQFVSGSLTVNTPAPVQVAPVQIARLLAPVVSNPVAGKDPVLPFLVWMAAEPLLAEQPEAAFLWWLENGEETMPLSGRLVAKTMRRLCDTKKAEMLETALNFVQMLPPSAPKFTVAALDGLIEGQKGKVLAPRNTEAFVQRMSRSSHEEVVARARQLGTMWGDAAALQASLELIRDPQAGLERRVGAIQSVKQQKLDAVRDTLVAVVQQDDSERVVQEAIRALSEVGGDHLGDQILRHWKRYSPTTQRLVAEAMASRRRWAQSFLTAIENKSIAAGEIPVTVVRTLVTSKDDYVRNRAGTVIGRFRDSDTDKLKLIADKRKVVLNGPVDLAKGREVAQKTCFNCHKFHGEGGEVGPDLTGVGRPNLDTLLANIIDPNQIIGIGYENVEIETKDGRSISGRLVEDTDTRVKLLTAGPKEEIIAKAEIESRRVSDLSVMPEGLEQMTDEDFRNLIWYLLNPPEDNRPLTPALRRELVGE